MSQNECCSSYKKNSDGRISASVDLSTIETLSFRVYEQFKRTTYEIFVNDKLLKCFIHKSTAQDKFDELALAFENYKNKSLLAGK